MAWQGRCSCVGRSEIVAGQERKQVEQFFMEKNAINDIIIVKLFHLGWTQEKIFEGGISHGFESCRCSSQESPD